MIYRLHLYTEHTFVMYFRDYDFVLHPFKESTTWHNLPVSLNIPLHSDPCHLLLLNWYAHCSQTGPVLYNLHIMVLAHSRPKLPYPFPPPTPSYQFFKAQRKLHISRNPA